MIAASQIREAGGTENLSNGDGERFPGRGTESQQTLLLSHTGPFRVPVRSGCAGTRHALPQGKEDPPGDGQPQHPLQEITDQRFWFQDRIPRMETVRGPLHPNAWKLAQLTRNQNRHLRQTIPGQSKDTRHLGTLRQECKAWCRRINKTGTKINWKFDRKAARKTFGYEKGCFIRSKN